jgi:hypothetical protein
MELLSLEDAPVLPNGNENAPDSAVEIELPKVPSLQMDNGNIKTPCLLRLDECNHDNDLILSGLNSHFDQLLSCLKIKFDDRTMETPDMIQYREASANFFNDFFQSYLSMKKFLQNRELFESNFEKSKYLMKTCVRTLESIHLFDAKTSLQGIIVRILRIFSRSEINCRYLGTFGIIEIFTAYLTQGKSNASVPTAPVFTSNVQFQSDATIHIFATLANLALLSENREALKNARIVKLLMNCIRQHRQFNEKLVELLGALSNLSCYEDSVSDILSDNGLDTIISIINNEAVLSNRELAMHVIYVLSSLSKFELKSESYNKLNWRVLVIMKYFPFDIQILCASLCILANVSSNGTRYVNCSKNTLGCI